MVQEQIRVICCVDVRAVGKAQVSEMGLLKLIPIVFRRIARGNGVSFINIKL